MKFWQKTFLSVFILFAFIFNGSMYLIIHQNYKNELDHVKERASAECYFIGTSIAQNFSGIEEKGSLSNSAVRDNFQTFQQYYKEQGIELELAKDTKIYCASGLVIDGERKELSVETGSQMLIIRKVDNKPYLFVCGSLPSPYQNYKVVVAMNLKSVIAARDQMIRLLLLIDLGAMLILALGLFFMVKQLLRPLNQLLYATNAMADGNYDYTVTLKGKDEFSILGSSFNQMEEQIKNHIEALQLENESKKRLIDNMAHELRTPLTAVLGYSEYLKMANVKEEEKVEVLDNTISEVKRLSKLSNTLLTMARLREDKMIFTPVSIENLFERIQYIFSRRMEEKKVQFNLIKGIEYLNGNQEMLEMLLTNLIENALRASNAGGTITVRIYEEMGHPVITVSDQGIGMPKEEIERIMEPFYRVDKARSREMGGVGLGVTLCHQIVTYHHASIQYQSEVGKGTMVRIDFTTS